MNVHSIRSWEIQLLKEKVRFAEIQKKVSEFEEKRNTLEMEQQKYHLLSIGLLKSASSVTLRIGTVNAVSLHQRARWIDKAYFLRTFSQAHENRLRSEILDLLPCQEAALCELRYVEEHKNQIEKTIRSYMVQSRLVREETECNEVSNLEVLGKYTVKQYGT